MIKGPAASSLLMVHVCIVDLDALVFRGRRDQTDGRKGGLVPWLADNTQEVDVVRVIFLSCRLVDFAELRVGSGAR